MTKDIDKLKKEYKNKSKGTTQEESQANWLWYLKERYSVDKYPEIYRELQNKPVASGAGNVRQYILGNIDHAGLYDTITSGTFDLYAQNLVDNEVADVPFDQNYYDMTHETALELLKALKDEVGTPWPDPICPDTIAWGASVVWLRFVENIHAMYNLPTVSGIRTNMIIHHKKEEEALDLNQFDEFAIVDDKERKDLEKLIDKSDSLASIRRN